MSKLFISHSSQDDAFVRELRAALTDHGKAIVFGTHFDKHRMPCAPSLCLSPTEGREDLEPQFGKL